jgi:hypothetical protein
MAVSALLHFSDLVLLPAGPPTHTPQEDSAKVDRQAEDDEKKKMAEAYWMFDGHPRKFREIISRRKKKKGEGTGDIRGGGCTVGS